MSSAAAQLLIGPFQWGTEPVGSVCAPVVSEFGRKSKRMMKQSTAPVAEIRVGKYISLNKSMLKEKAKTNILYMTWHKENKSYLIYSDAYFLCPSMCVVLIDSASVSDFLSRRKHRILIFALSCYRGSFNPFLQCSCQVHHLQLWKIKKDLHLTLTHLCGCCWQIVQDEGRGRLMCKCTPHCCSVNCAPHGNAELY